MTTKTKLFEYQETIVSEVLDKFQHLDRVMMQAATGAGKTFMFSYIAKHFVQSHKQKAVILCHREELCNQTASSLNQIGLKVQVIEPKTKRIHAFVDVYVCMIETIYRRLESGKFAFNENEISIVIADEAHIRVFEKIYDYFPKAKILGVTATPTSLKKEKYFKCTICGVEHQEETECHGLPTEEWTRPFSFSSVYQDIVLGPQISELIKHGQLVQDISFVRASADLSNLKTDGTGEYTTKSLEEVYNNDDAAFNALLNYQELCAGKRTMIFNASTKHNLTIYNKFKDAGLNIRMYDSVNAEESGSREELVKWFQETPDAILASVGTFTAGFDCREVEAVIVNRNTGSLALWLQMVGRGGRSSNKIFKDSFIVIDGGDNIARFGEWSADRDWNDIFFNGNGKPRAKKIQPDDVQDCLNCGGLFPKREIVCPLCGTDVERTAPETAILQRSKLEESTEVLQPVREIPPPSGKHIYEYTKLRGENISFAFRILQNRIVDMFIYYRVTRDRYERAKASGKLQEKVKKLILKPYFFLIKQEDIQSGAHRTIDTLLARTLNKIEAYYYPSKRNSENNS